MADCTASWPNIANVVTQPCMASPVRHGISLDQPSQQISFAQVTPPSGSTRRRLREPADLLASMLSLFSTACSSGDPNFHSSQPC